MKNRLAAFTLVELLAVIGIIAVLSALIFSATQSVFKTRDETVALANMRQLGVALRLYTNEHDYTLPGRVTGEGETRWPGLLAADLSDVRIYAAPGVANYLSE